MKILPKEISLAEAMRIRSELAQGNAIDWASVETQVANEDVAQAEVDPDALGVALNKLRRRFPEKLGPKSRDGTAFDSEAATLIHKALPLNDLTASSQGFWAWLSLRYFWELTNWRHGRESEPALPENFSITKRYHGLPERLWFRAELGQVDGEDPYRIVRTATDRDFWESGIVRTSYCSCRAVARAFVQYQFQKGNGGYLHLTDPGGVRELYKRLRRIYATVALETLDEQQALKLITDLGRGLKLRKG